ncbi:MAG: outer membrane beta-barrel protein [Deltaproteobacteria bacterium]|nr:outer membrane beta-barrel protein [Deltaproteobacteria bacterium]
MRSLLAVALVAASASAASAGTYLGLGIGTAASGHVGDDASSQGTDGNRSGRLFLGFRFGNLSVEGGVMRFSQMFKNTADDATQLGADLKYSLPLGNGFEVFGRGGLQRTQLSNDQASISGNGWLLGAGFEYRLNLGVTAASLFVDYTHSQTSYDQGQTGGMTTIDSSASMWMAGATLAL